MAAILNHARTIYNSESSFSGKIDANKTCTKICIHTHSSRCFSNKRKAMQLNIFRRHILHKVLSWDFFPLRMRFQCALAFDHTSEFCALLVVPIWWSHFTIKCNPNDLVHKMWFKGIQRFAFKNSFSSFAVHSAASGDCKSTCQVNTSVIDDICS